MLFFYLKGIYGKLDVLYAGIVAENACTENKNRFLVFFDDGFAQYLPVKKLHHVFHTGLSHKMITLYILNGQVQNKFKPTVALFVLAVNIKINIDFILMVLLKKKLSPSN